MATKGTRNDGSRWVTICLHCDSVQTVMITGRKHCAGCKRVWSECSEKIRVDD